MDYEPCWNAGIGSKLALAHKPDTALTDEETEADEMFQMRGKGTKHVDLMTPRRRANKRPGKGTMANDRPPVWGGRA
ncbi:MAG: hypothetical protein HS114_28530 [Anaerolineales bacterium]|nr:hypothetical protein [Anaerolineales bacterium]